MVILWLIAEVVILLARTVTPWSLREVCVNRGLGCWDTDEVWERMADYVDRDQLLQRQKDRGLKDTLTRIRYHTDTAMYAIESIRGGIK